MTRDADALVSLMLTPGLAGFEIHDRGQPVTIRDGEAGPVAQSGDKRRRDFSLGRACAHAALTQLGGDAPVIGRQANGAPLWPTGFCGSITHTQGYAAALAACRSDFLSLGLDAERLGGVTEKLWPRLFDAQECAALAALTPQERPRAATIRFSAKEASFKAWSALGEKPLAFRDIHIAPREGGFDARSAAGSLKGRFVLRGDLVLTAALVPAR